MQVWDSNPLAEQPYLHPDVYSRLERHVTITKAGVEPAYLPVLQVSLPGIAPGSQASEACMNLFHYRDGVARGLCSLFSSVTAKCAN